MGYRGKHMPAPCEVCGTRVMHKNAVIVGRKLNGTTRLIHQRCAAQWRTMATEKMAGWLENKTDLSTLAPGGGRRYYPLNVKENTP